MAEPYLEKQQAVARLVDDVEGFGISEEVAGQITGGDLRLASDELDESGPFVGRRTSRVQEREWPRKFGGDLTVDLLSILNPEITPESILDWVALRALQLATEDEAEVISERDLDTSTTYARPLMSQTERRMKRLLGPYLLRSGGRP